MDQILTKSAGIILASLVLSSCGHSLISPRSTNPLMKDRVGISDRNEVYALSSRADRRSILVMGDRRICAEPPPDVAEAVFSEVSANAAKDGEISAEFGSTLQTAIMQLTRRSQGLDYFRTGSFVNCMAYHDGRLSPEAYQAAMKELLDISAQMTLAEIKNLPEVSKAVLQVSRAKEVEAKKNTSE